MSDTTLGPEQLWARAHEHVRRGDFATAVRDLAQCFQLLQAANDPRVYEVHKRWTEVHKMYLEDGARQEAPPAQKAPSVEAEAESAANAGDLDRAIALYQRAAQQQPSNELVRERLQELTQAKRRATELATGTAPRVSAVAVERPVAAAERPTITTSPPSASAQATTVPTHAERSAVAKVVKTDDDWSDVSMDEPPVTRAAPAMAVDDAPVGMQSLDVPFSVGDAIDAFQADELPVAGAATTPPQPVVAAGARAGDVAFLEELIGRVHANRRSSAA